VILDISPLVKHRDYRLIYFGQLVSLFGTMITYVAVPVQVFALTQSSFVVGLLGAVQLIPLLLFALLGGAYADSMDRRRLLIIAELLMACGSATLALNAFSEKPSVVVIFVVTAAMSALNGFHRPALDAATPQLVAREDLKAVSALGSLRHSISAILGPMLGGVMIASMGVAWTYVADFLTFAASLVALAGIRAIAGGKNAAKPGLNTIVEGLRYAVSRPELIGTYVVDIIAMMFAMPMALFPAMAAQWGGDWVVGWLYSSMSIGSLLMTATSGWTKRIHRHGAAVVIGAALWGVAIIGLGFAPGLITALVFLGLAGAADSVSAVFRGTIWNETIPSELRGRLAGVEMISYLSGPLLGNARAGWVASISSNSFSMVSGGVISVAGILLCIPLLPAFWKYHAARRASAAGNSTA
jgi:MFS family permease